MGRNERAFAIPMVCGIIGVVLAIMLQLLHESSIILDELTTGTIQLREIQLIVIIMWMIGGVVLAATQR